MIAYLHENISSIAIIGSLLAVSIVYWLHRSSMTAEQRRAEDERMRDELGGPGGFA